MAYLDLTPMLQAMRARPSEFEMQGSYLRHMPSHHLLNFDIWGNARVHARCDCAMLDVSREQSEEIKAAIAAWKVVYWEPHLAQIEAEKRAAKINREFSSHFQPPGLWQRFLALFRRNDDRFGLIFEEEAADETSRAAGTPETARTERRELIQN
jgi:hypothetical protein